MRAQLNTSFVTKNVDRNKQSGMNRSLANEVVHTDSTTNECFALRIF